MDTAGKAVVRPGGKRGVLVGGKAAVYNAEESCPACCIEFTHGWLFTDKGFIDGGQNGARREYHDPADVPASPWSISNNGLSLRLDWEDDWNCKNHNRWKQDAHAWVTIVVPRAMIMTVNWSGMGERNNPNSELMRVWVDDVMVCSAHAPGGGLGCLGGMGPVVSDPPPPQQVTLQPGPHTLRLYTSTVDALFHFGAWYQFDITFDEPPPVMTEQAQSKTTVQNNPLP